jgi:hypothetical protein
MAGSQVQIQPLPTPPTDQDSINNTPKSRFTESWNRWFLAVQKKVNVISASLVNFASTAFGAGIISSDGAGNFSSSTLTQLIDAGIGNTQGDILYRDATTWKVLPPGTNGQVLETQGAGTNPIWSSTTGGGNPVFISPQTTSYTLQSTDLPAASSYKGLVSIQSSSATNLTIPPHSSVAFPNGSILYGVQLGSGGVTIQAGTGVSLIGNTTAGGQNSIATAIQISQDVWLVSGNLAYSSGTLYSSVILADAPLGYWRLGETTGSTASDSSGNNYTGTYVSCTQGSASLILNNAGNLSVSGNGTSSQITVGAISALYNLNNNCSIELWYKPADNTGTYGLWSAGYQGIGIRQNAANIELLSDYSVSLHTFTVGFVAGTVYHIVLTISSSNVCTLYINGTSVGTYTKSATFSGAYVRIGADGQDSTTVTNWFNGTIDEVAVYQSALTSTQITNHYNAGI